MLQIAPFALLQQIPASVQRESVFGFLLCDVEFQQHVDDPLVLGGLLVNLLQ